MSLLSAINELRGAELATLRRSLHRAVGAAARAGRVRLLLIGPLIEYWQRTRIDLIEAIIVIAARTPRQAWMARDTLERATTLVLWGVAFESDVDGISAGVRDYFERGFAPEAESLTEASIKRGSSRPGELFAAWAEGMKRERRSGHPVLIEREITFSGEPVLA